ncbi:MAG: acyltransferase family protein [Akkermansiaceae bacterium]
MLDHLNKFNYRADIDGLRAIAVIGVVLFHAGLGVSGGFVGVDVFFVISGFLITSLILKDLKSGNFSIVEFWERRARRIFPALIVVVIATLIAGFFLMLPFGYQVLGQSAVALTIFASNIQFWRTSGYFDPAAEENPLLHTWSLSVEEQFYLIVPLLLCLIFTLRLQKHLGLVLGLVVLASLLFSIYWVDRDPKGAFYLLPSRAWELGVGSMLVLAGPVSSRVLRELMAWFGLAGILYACFFYDAHTAFPGLAAIVPVTGTAMLICAGMQRDGLAKTKPTIIQQLLETKVLVGLGLISYSFYLWHWPFFAFHRYLFSQSPSVLVAFGYIIIALLISIASLKYVERPFRERRWVPSRNKVFLFTGLVSLLTLSTGLSLWKTRGMPSRLPAKVLELDATKDDAFYQKLKSSTGEENLFLPLGAKNDPCQLMVWGDSHGGVLLSMINELCVDHGVSALAATRGQYPPVIEWSGSDSGNFEHKIKTQYADKVMSQISSLAKAGELKQVLLVFRWAYYVKNAPRAIDDAEPREGFDSALISTVQNLEKLGLEVYILLEVPNFGVHVPKAAALHQWHGLPQPQLSQQDYQERQDYYMPLIKRLQAETPNVHLIDASPYFISREGRVSFIDEQGVLLYRDDHHLTEHASMRLKPLFEKLLLN